MSDIDAVRDLQHIAVQVDGKRTVNIQEGGVCEVVLRPDGFPRTQSLKKVIIRRRARADALRGYL